MSSTRNPNMGEVDANNLAFFMNKITKEYWTPIFKKLDLATLHVLINAIDVELHERDEEYQKFLKEQNKPKKKYRM